MDLNFQGIWIGLGCLLIIGIFHPIVIKCEYYFSARVWPVFLGAGLLLLFIALFLKGSLSIVVALFGITCLWSIKELKEQEKRVKKGWFPKNENRRSGRE